MYSRTLWLNAVILIALGVESFAAPAGPSPIDYNRDIRPILAENCFACHGPDSAARKADLRLDSFAAATAALDGSKPAIVPGDPDASGFIARIETNDEDDLMPPPKMKKVLKPEHKALLRRWVAAGAEYQDHWSLIAPVRPAVPVLNSPDWPQTPVDSFVLARLEKQGLRPEKRADRRTLARRVSLDLTGLPPAPALVERFVSDTSPKAFESLVDQLLASETYGEHRARYWLDAARYADTHGIHIDNFREIWSYREWVINAFNSNMPFDQFTIEQLAGDLLPNPTMEQRIATGFNRCNITTSEGGAIDDEYLALYTRDRTETTATVWMGLTAGCASCHDHKFDPISQKEFYQLSAFFNNTTQPAMDGNRKDTPPVIVVPAATDRARWESLPPIKTAAQKAIDDRRENARSAYQEWLGDVNPDTLLQGLPLEGLLFSALLDETSGTNVQAIVSGFPKTIGISATPATQAGVIAATAWTTSSNDAVAFPEIGNFSTNQAFSAAAWVRLHNDDKAGALFARMDEDKKHRGWDFWFDDRKPGIHIVNEWPSSAIKVVSRKALETNRWTHVAITYDGSSKAEGVAVYIDGEKVDVDRPNNNLSGAFDTEAPLKIGQRKNGDRLEQAGVQDLRIYSRALKQEDAKALHTRPRAAWLARKPVDEKSEDEKKLLYDVYLTGFDAEFQSSVNALAALQTEENDIKRRGTIAHVMNEKESAPEAFVLFRGEYDQRRDKVTPGVPKALPAFPSDAPTNRLGLAQWLIRPEHPLTARVTVNRMWQELFGDGIVRSAGDFGITGDTPENQDLLDWLAVEFRESGWDVKRIYKLMVMSAAYQQSATVTPEKLAKDPENRLISRGPRHRMDAEMLRDYALASSGLLTHKIGGPSVRPYQPDGVWEMVAMPGSDTSKYKTDTGEDLYRRSLYTFWKRSAPPASMDILNAPSRETCMVRRERTNTPLQALATLNDPQFIEAARHLAERALAEAGNSENARLDYMARKTLSRPLRDKERRIVRSTLKELHTHYHAEPAEAEKLLSVGASKSDPDLADCQLAAYTMVANQLMNLDETLNK